MEKCKRSDFIELSKEIMDKGGNLRFRAKGGSMHPFISDGDILQVKPASADKVEVGDVVFYRSSRGGVAIHRVIKRISRSDKLSLAMKGDSASGFDEIIHPYQVQGKVISIERKGREIRLDRGWSRIGGVLWARISIFSPWIYYPFRKIKRMFT